MTLFPNPLLLSEDHQAAIKDAFKASSTLPDLHELQKPPSLSGYQALRILRWSDSLPNFPAMTQLPVMTPPPRSIASSQGSETQQESHTSGTIGETSASSTPPLETELQPAKAQIAPEHKRELSPEREWSQDIPLSVAQQLETLRSETSAVKEHLQHLIQVESMMGSYRFGSWFDSPQAALDIIESREDRGSYSQASNLITLHDRLPSEAISLIGDFLAGANAFGSLASLNATCHAVHLQTLPALYEITIWDSVNVLATKHLDPSAVGFRISPGLAFTKYLILDEDDSRDLERVWTALGKSLLFVFPRLVLKLLKYRKCLGRPNDDMRSAQPSEQWNSLLLATSAPHRCDIELSLPISARMLNYILKDLPIRWETATRTIMQVHQIDSLERITLIPGAYITQEAEPLDWGLYYRQERNGPGLELELNVGMTADGATRETLEAIFEMIMFPRPTPLVESVQSYQPGLFYGQQWELRISGCSLGAYHLILELLPKLIPCAFAANLSIAIHFGVPPRATLAEAEILLEHAVRVYSALWSCLPPRRRQRAHFIPFLELRGLLIGDSPEIRGSIMPERGSQGRRFECVMSSNDTILEGYPRSFGLKSAIYARPPYFA